MDYIVTNMKINELLYKTPEMTEEKLLQIMDSHIDWLKKDFKNIKLFKYNLIT